VWEGLGDGELGFLGGGLGRSWRCRKSGERGWRGWFVFRVGK